MNWLTKLFCKHRVTREATQGELAYNLAHYNGQQDFSGTCCMNCGKLLSYIIKQKSAIVYSDPIIMLEQIRSQMIDEYSRKESFNWYHC